MLRRMGPQVRRTLRRVCRLWTPDGAVVDLAVMPGLHDDSAFIRACRGGRPTRTPVWFMRQAGRSLPEYRKIRGAGTILACHRRPGSGHRDHPPARAPVRRRRSDPVLRHHDAGARDRVRRRHRARGRAGRRAALQRPQRPRSAPPARPRGRHPVRPRDRRGTWSPSSPSRSSPSPARRSRSPATCSRVAPRAPTCRTKALMHTDAAALVRPDGPPGRPGDRLAAVPDRRRRLGRCSCSTRGRARCSPADYERFVLPASTKVLAAVEPTRGAAHPLRRQHLGAVRPDRRRRRRGRRGRLADTARPGPHRACRHTSASRATWIRRSSPPGGVATEPAVRDVLTRGGGNPGGRGGHIFNLGHGVLPETDPETLERVVEMVHGHPSTRGAA